jgi:hypothetical protein
MTRYYEQEFLQWQLILSCLVVVYQAGYRIECAHCNVRVTANGQSSNQEVKYTMNLSIVFT